MASVFSQLWDFYWQGRSLVLYRTDQKLNETEMYLKDWVTVMPIHISFPWDISKTTKVHASLPKFSSQYHIKGFPWSNSCPWIKKLSLKVHID